MSNFLPERVISDIKNLAARGNGIRAISCALGISKNTVARYYKKESAAPCGCGRPAGHKGWCKHRYGKSVARQAFHAARSGKVIQMRPKIKIARISAKRKTYLRWLGKIGKARPLPYWEMYSVIVEVTGATRTLPSELRDDIRQDIIVAACDGYIRREEIISAVKFFFRREWARLKIHSSIDQFADERGYCQLKNPWSWEVE